jgi:hypothetical protein
MRKQDYLVGLIAALEPNEKRYFKLFSSLQPGEKRYLKLFDALEKKKKYEASELCDELGIESRQLADDKHYLTQILLQCLRNYDQESTELAILRNNRENAQSLINRRMFSFANDIIEKTLERAWELEAFELIDALLLSRSSCRQNLNEHDDDDDTLEKHGEATDRLTEVIELMNLRSKARSLEVKAAKAKQFEKILSHPLIEGGVGKLNSLRAKSLRYEALAHYNSTCLNDNALLLLAREERELYLKHPLIKLINPIVYITNLYRLSSGESDFEVRQTQINILLQEVANPEIKLSNQRRDSFLWTATLMSLWNLRHLYRFKGALPIAEKAYNLGHARSDYDRFSVAFEYAMALLHNGKVMLAADIVDEMLRFKSDVRSDMQPFIRLLHIMVQLELRNYELIPHIIKSVRFWLKKKEEKDNPEVSLFLKHAGLIAKAPADKREAWRALLKEIEAGKLETITRLLQFDVWVKDMIKR